MADFAGKNFDLLYAEEFALLRGQIEQIKVMLWAGDYWAATKALTSIHDQYGELIERALKYILKLV